MLRDLFSLFPAYAGVIPTHGARQPVIGTFPRICGGDPYTDDETKGMDNFSPHMRG